MSRHPYSRYWKRVIAFLATGVAISAGLFLVHANLLSLIVLLVTLLATGIYLIGESSDLPGTAGEGDKDVVPASTSLEDLRMRERDVREQDRETPLLRARPAAAPAARRDREDIERATSEGMAPGRP